MPLALETAWHFIAARWRWQNLDAELLADYQEQRARRVVEFAQAHSPFYRRHWQGFDRFDWRSLPTVDKRQMMENFSEFNTCGVSLEQAMQVALQAETSRDFRPRLPGPARLTVGLSSGTSGHRGLFLVSPHEQAAWAGSILARTLPRLPWEALGRGGLRVAFFLRANSNLYQQTRSALVRFRYFDLMQPLEESVAALNRFQPEVLIGPPLLLGLLASELGAGRLRARPQRLISVAEVLEPQDARRLEAAFQTPVEQVYQCTEGLLAVTCPMGSLHLQEDLVAVQLEPLEGSGEAAFTPILTDLRRTTQPIIRYRLNDVLVLGRTPCRCGSVFRTLARIQGRCDDICYFPERAGGGLRPFFPDAIRRMVLLAHPQIEDYLALQDAPGRLRIHLALPAGSFGAAAQAVRQQVLGVLLSYDCQLDAAPGSLEVVEGVPAPAPGVKRRRVQALSRPETAA